MLAARFLVNAASGLSLPAGVRARGDSPDPFRRAGFRFRSRTLSRVAPWFTMTELRVQLRVHDDPIPPFTPTLALTMVRNPP